MVVEVQFQESSIDLVEAKVSLRKDSRKSAEDELRYIEERDGIIKPEEVVEFARDEATALHKHFTWDDGEAAHQWRLAQARQFISAFVTIVPKKDSEIVTRAFVHIENTEYGDGYVSLTRVLSDEEKTKRMLATAHRDLRTFQKKYSVLSEIAELKGVFKAIEELANSED